MFQDSWSPNIVIGCAKKMELFPTELLSCTSTLYHWIERGIMKTKNINLLEKVSRKPRGDSSSYREHRQVLGPSIDDRPIEIDTSENKRRSCFTYICRA